MPAYDPDGAAARMTAFIQAMGGSNWAEVSTQYYETVGGTNVYIQNPTNVLGGVWYDDTNPIHDNVSGLELAQEAQRAVAHFGGHLSVMDEAQHGAKDGRLVGLDRRREG